MINFPQRRRSGSAITARPAIEQRNEVNGFEGSIIMGEEDVLHASQAAKIEKIVAVHMDAINHMSLTREELHTYVKKQGLESRMDIPEDGASLEF